MDPFPDLSDGEAADPIPKSKSGAVWFTRGRWDGYFALLLALALPVVLIAVGRGDPRAAAGVPVLLVAWAVVRSAWPAEGRAVPSVGAEPGGWPYIAFVFGWALVGLLSVAAIEAVAPLPRKGQPADARQVATLLGFFGAWGGTFLVVTKLARGRITRGPRRAAGGPGP